MWKGCVSTSLRPIDRSNNQHVEKNLRSPYNSSKCAINLRFVSINLETIIISFIIYG